MWCATVFKIRGYILLRIYCSERTIAKLIRFQKWTICCYYMDDKSKELLLQMFEIRFIRFYLIFSILKYELDSIANGTYSRRWYYFFGELRHWKILNNNFHLYKNRHASWCRSFTKKINEELFFWFNIDINSLTGNVYTIDMFFFHFFKKLFFLQEYAI